MNSEEQQCFMQIAVNLSQYSVDCNTGGPFGAVIVKNGNIVGTSLSQIYHEQKPETHAEVRAIRDACRNLKTLDLSGCQIYSSSEPCPMCLAVIYWAQISEIYYCNSENNIESFGYINNCVANAQQRPKVRRFRDAVQIPENKALNVIEGSKQKQSRAEVVVIPQE